MAANIHPSALIHPSAVIADDVQIAAGVQIAPYVVIENDVQIAANSQILTGSVLHSGARIGADCHIGPYATLAGIPLDSNFANKPSYVILEDKVRVANFSSISRASGAGESTFIAEGAWLGVHCHIAHNCHIAAHAKVVSHSALAGHVSIGKHAFISASSYFHQFVRVGAYAIIGGMSTARRDVLPFSMAQGADSIRHYRLNTVGLKRQGFSAERRKILQQAFRAYRRRDEAKLQELARESEDVRELLEFREESARGVSKFISS